MKLIKFLAGIALLLAGSGAALAANHYDIVAVDDVNGDPTFFGSMTTTSPFSLQYGFGIVDFSLDVLANHVTYDAGNSTVAVEAQGFLFTARDASSSFELTFYPDASYYSEYLVPGQDAIDNSGYVAFNEVPAVPEPASVALLLAGVGLLGLRARRERVAGSAAQMASPPATLSAWPLM